MKNKLTDLNDHLFMQLERLNDEDLGSDELLKEIERSKAVSVIAKDITSNAKVVLEAQKAAWEWNKSPGEISKILES